MAIADDIENLTGPALAAAGLELVYVQYQREPLGWVLRFFIDKPGGISLDDCADWSHRLEEMVDQSGLIAEGSYALEVSSPGLQRPLRKKEDFERFIGLEAIVKTFAPINNQRNFHGVIQGVENDAVALVDRTNGLVRVPLANIAGAKLDPPVEV